MNILDQAKIRLIHLLIYYIKIKNIIKHWFGGVRELILMQHVDNCQLNQINERK